MTHLKMQETEKQPQERKIWKLNLVRRLYEKGLNQEDIRNLYRFIDWVIMLPKDLEDEFWQDYQKIEQEQTMPYVTSGQRIETKRELRGLISRQLKKLVGEVPENAELGIKALSCSQLRSLGEAILDFTSIDDLHNWLQANPPLSDIDDRYDY
ncbi:hypothetical protein DSM106972_039820 [Dulcicalothrix desertica PCC 7102]|uniref:DUF4351 domain-containing protein n=1 Tax=Dulcicalothrix desertica PCC 7102 TaxID=232991 RepID=A0A433VGC7_9CYAN|nr:DUF4351 domain-containing protein [Dulcicalothrix desertica]RUT05161.1 hypothetical protein DSM106972_039820 [Dulcicalothrix desertica PCC 7102]